MKKHNLLKILGICFGAFIILSWFIPITTYSEGVATIGKTSPYGIFDLFRYPLLLFEAFIHYGLLFLAIGGFYGVLNKTGVYTKIVDKVAAMWHKKEKWFLVLVIGVLAILSSISGLYIPMFIIVPFLISVIIKLGYDQKTAFATTIGAILVGMIGTTYGIYLSATNFINDNNTVTYLFGPEGFFKLGVNSYILVRFIILAIFTFLFTMLVIKKAKFEKTKEIPFYDNKITSKKKTYPLVILSILTVVLIFVGMYAWDHALGLQIFNNIYNSIMNLTIGNDYSIIKNILGNTLGSFGYYSYYEMICILIIMSLVISWIYSIKIKDTFESFIDGAKKMVKPALYVMIANIVFLFGYLAIRYMVLYNTPDYSSGTMSLTISNFILGLSPDFNIFTTSLATMTSSLFYNDIYFLAYELTNPLSVIATSNLYPVVAIIIQSIFGIMMMIMPTSLLLVAGMSYLNISYKEWVKYIWIYLLEGIAIIIIIAFIMTLLI